MNTENQVTSLELSKRLRDLGVPQMSIICWAKRFQEYGGNWVLSGPLIHYKDVTQTISAFTVSELGQFLFNKAYTQAAYENGKWQFACREVFMSADQDTVFYADTEADARAKMLIYFIEKGIIKP